MLKLDRSKFKTFIPLSVQLGSFLFAIAPNSSKNSNHNLPVLLGLAGLSWMGGCAIAPQMVQAYTARFAIPLLRQGEESYQTLLTRAENIARAAAQRSFDSDILVTQVSISIIGQNNSATVPILKLEVSRQDWRKFPDPQRWARYFPNAPILLGISPTPSPSAVPSTQPEPTESATPTDPESPEIPILPPLPALPPLP
ncbi:hypothetical protein [Lusitaniella coriacea]|uniref:hypothetical protein n=1 Tax=Lusitaniella coriacea TaxID=1983105 RepID=UPI003CED8E1F